MRINLIVAADINGVIGKDNTLIWHLPTDLKNFKNLTTGNNIIMGRKTYESIGKALPNRLNIVISKQTLVLDKCIVVNSIKSAIKKADATKDVFVIGGSQIYKEFLSLDLIDRIYLTKVWENFDGDSYFKFNEDRFKCVFRKDFEANSIDKHKFSYFVYEKKTI